MTLSEASEVCRELIHWEKRKALKDVANVPKRHYNVRPFVYVAVVACMSKKINSFTIY